MLVFLEKHVFVDRIDEVVGKMEAAFVNDEIMQSVYAVEDEHEQGLVSLLSVIKYIIEVLEAFHNVAHLCSL